MSRARLAGASTVIGTLLAGVAGFFVLSALVRDREGVREGLTGAGAGWLVVAVALAVVGMLAIAVAWRSVVRLLGGDLSWGDTVARYFLGELGKYVPGGVWPVVGRGELAVRAGVPRLVAYGSVALSLAALYLAAMLLALAAVPAMLAGDEGREALWVLGVLPFGVLGLHPAVLGRMRSLLERVSGRRVDLPIPRWRASLALVAGYLPAWLAIGGSTWAVSRALGQDAAVVEVGAAAILSWIVGFLLVPVPGGIGVREVVFVAASGLAAGPAAAVAIVARVMFLLVDAGGALAGSGWLARRRLAVRREVRSRPPAGDRPPAGERRRRGR